MKSLLLFVAIGVTLFASAQESPTIKGHKIGESITDYLAIESGGTEKAAHALADCAALLNNPKQRKKQEYRAETCRQIAAAWNGDAELLTGEAKGGKFQFASRKLVAITLAFGMDFGAVERDLIEKFGRPDSEEQVPFENGFGAVFFHPRAIWTRRPDVVVSAAEDAFTTPALFVTGKVGPAINVIRVEIADRAYVDSLAQKEQQRANSLN